MSTATKLPAPFAGVLLGLLATLALVMISLGSSKARSEPPETKEPPVAIRQPAPPAARWVATKADRVDAAEATARGTRRFLFVNDDGYYGNLVLYGEYPFDVTPGKRYRVEVTEYRADAGDLFEQMRDRIDRRIDEKLVAGLEDASAVQSAGKTSVVGALVLAALTKIVAGLLKAMLEALILGAVVALLWKYGWCLVIGFASVAALVSGPVGWLAGRKAAK